MGRIKIVLPEKEIFKIQLPVRITDVNYGNHLGNDSLVSMLHEARVSWLASMQYSELNIEGHSVIMSDLAVSYVNESFYGDMLTFTLYFGEQSTAGFELFYLIETNRDDRKIIIAKAKTGIVFFDYQNRKITTIPKEFLKKINP